MMEVGQDTFHKSYQEMDKGSVDIDLSKEFQFKINTKCYWQIFISVLIIIMPLSYIVTMSLFTG